MISVIQGTPTHVPPIIIVNGDQEYYVCIYNFLKGVFIELLLNRSHY